MSAATIGSALADKRRELGLEKGRAANKIGMSRTTYSSYEQDAQRPSVDVFPALAKFLDISIEELLTLYGATCVAALRSSLELMMSNNPDGRVETESPAESPPVDKIPHQSQSEVPLEAPTILRQNFEPKATVVTPTVQEAVEAETETETETEAEAEAADYVKPEEVPEERTVPSDREASAVHSEYLEAPVTELSHLIEQAPKTERREKSSNHKKKKKKKPKKN